MLTIQREKQTESGSGVRGSGDTTIGEGWTTGRMYQEDGLRGQQGDQCCSWRGAHTAVQAAGFRCTCCAVGCSVNMAHPAWPTLTQAGWGRAEPAPVRMPGFESWLCHMLSKLLNLFVPHFPHLSNGKTIVPTHRVIMRLRWVSGCKFLVNALYLLVK